MGQAKRMDGNVVIGQSGGPTAVINQSLVGCVEALREHDVRGKILGARHGVRGITEERFVDFGDVSAVRLERLAATPSAALGSSRDKPDAAYCGRILDAFRKHDVRTFFYIGGNDSSDTCRIVNELARHDGYELRAFHIPKTVDNDLVENDHTPGYGSAARFVACAFLGDNLDNRSLPGIKINVVMGRHAGFLTAASSLARTRPEDGPHLVYVPEVAFEEERFLADVDAVYKKYGRAIIAVSEGVHAADGTPMVTKLASAVEKDAHGNVQLSGTGALGDFLVELIKARLGKKLRVRADTFGYLQRSYPESISRTDQTEARAAGHFAAVLAVDGKFTDGSVAIKRLSQTPYIVGYERIELAAVAAKTRHLPSEYIVDGKMIAESFRDYALPIVGALPEVEQI